MLLFPLSIATSTFSGSIRGYGAGSGTGSGSALIRGSSAGGRGGGSGITAAPAADGTVTLTVRGGGRKLHLRDVVSGQPGNSTSHESRDYSISGSDIQGVSYVVVGWVLYRSSTLLL